MHSEYFYPNVTRRHAWVWLKRFSAEQIWPGKNWEKSLAKKNRLAEQKKRRTNFSIYFSTNSEKLVLLYPINLRANQIENAVASPMTGIDLSARQAGVTNRHLKISILWDHRLMPSGAIASNAHSLTDSTNLPTPIWQWKFIELKNVGIAAATIELVFFGCWQPFRILELFWLFRMQHFASLNFIRCATAQFLSIRIICTRHHDHKDILYDASQLLFCQSAENKINKWVYAHLSVKRFLFDNNEMVTNSSNKKLFA